MLRYSLEVAPTEEDVVRHCERTGRPLPEAIANAPELWTGLELYFEGFMDLCYDRPMGMGFGPIAWMTVQGYCELRGFDSEQTEAMHYHCRALDSVWLDYQNRKSTNNAKR